MCSVSMDIRLGFSSRRSVMSRKFVDKFDGINSPKPQGLKGLRENWRKDPYEGHGFSRAEEAMLSDRLQPPRYVFSRQCKQPGRTEKQNRRG